MKVLNATCVHFKMVNFILHELHLNEKILMTLFLAQMFRVMVGLFTMMGKL